MYSIYFLGVSKTSGENLKKEFLKKKDWQKKDRQKKPWQERYRYWACGLVLFAVIAYLLSQPRWLFLLAARIRPGALYAVSLSAEAPKLVALTIDDGPSPFTTDILAVLDRYNAKATFFNISAHIPSHTLAVQQAVAAGHELGNHLTKDEASIRMSPDEFEADLLAAESLLVPFLQDNNSKTESTPESTPNPSLRWLRPGMGWYNAEMVNITESHGYQLVLGSTFPYDTHLPWSQFASTFILATIQPGDIIVLHDGAEGRGQRTLTILNTILPVLQARGYQFVTLTELTQTAAQ